jgi:cell division protein FtsB
VAAEASSYWVTLYRLAWGVLLALFLVVLTCIFLPKCREHRQLQKTKASLTESNQQKEADIRALVDKQQKFRTDPAFVERTAREAGLIKPNETVFRFSSSDTPSEPSQPPSVAKKPLPSPGPAKVPPH